MPLPANETERLAALHTYAVLDTLPEPAFDDLTALAAQICGTPIALISLIDEHRQWFKSSVGLAATETPRGESFCAHALDSPAVLHVRDAAQDARFADNPFVTGEPHIRFYAGAPLLTPAGHALGTLCVIDRVPRQLTPEQERALQVLSRQVMGQLQLRRQTHDMSRAQAALLGILEDQQQAEKQVRASEAQLRRAQRIAQLGSWELTLATGKLRLAGEIHRIFGVPPDKVETTYEAFLASVHSDDRAQLQAAQQRVRAGEAGLDLQHRIVRPDGAVRWVHEQAELERDDSGRPVRLIGTVLDITEQKQAQSERETLFNLSDDLLAVIHFDGPLEQVNPAWTKTLGWLAEELVGRPSADFILPEDRARTLRAREELKQGRPLRNLENRYRCKDGSYRWLSWNSRPLMETRQVFAVARDITEQKRAEEALRRNSELLTDIVKALQEIAASGMTLQDILTLMADRAQSLTGATGVIIVFVEGEEMVYRAAAGRAQSSIGLRLPRHDSLSGLAVRQNMALLCTDTETDDRVDRAACRQVGVRSMVVAPLRADQQVIGVLKIMSDRPHAFNQHDMDNLQILVESLGAVIQRHRANELLQASNVQYRLLFAHNPHPMWVFDESSHRFLAVNEASLRHYGYTEEEFLGMTIMDIRPAQDAAELRQELNALPRGATRLGHGVYQHYKKDGTIIQVEITSSTIVFGDHPARLVLAQDITARLETEEKAARSNRALQMLSRCNEALIRADQESDLLAAICRIATEVGGVRMAWVGYAANDVKRSILPQAHAGVEAGYLGEVEHSWADDRPVGQGPAGRTIRDGVPVVVSDFSQLPAFRPWLQAAQSRGYAGVICLPLKDQNRTFGVLFLYLPEARPVPADELRLLQEMADDLAFGIGNLRVRAERRLAQQEIAQQAALIDKATDAIFVRDLAHHITFWSKGAERLYGWTAAEAIGQPLDGLLKIDRTPFAEAERALQARGDWNGETMKTAKNGTVLTIDGRWNLLRDDAGQPRAVLTIDTNVTERKKLEAQFLRAQRMESIGTLAGGIAHDLNNLLAPITMGVGLIQQFTSDEKMLTVVKHIERSAQRGTDLVRQVLSFARGVEGARVTIKLDHIVREVESIASHTFPKNIIFERDLPKVLRLIVGDPTQLNQVVLNLCVNARDAMPDGGRLVVSGRNIEIDEQYAVMNRGVSPGSYVVLEVTDNGCGMPKEVVDRIFEPFFTTKELGKGTGLGLSTVIGIVRSHGGFVNVYSEVGRGSTFKVYLPVPSDQLATAPVTSAVEALPRGQGELILLVDDEASILSITRQTLETFGYRVITAEDGAQAIGLYVQSRAEIAAVLTDMMMPVMDGPALIAAIRRVNPAARIIAASGLNANGNVARAAHAGVKHFLSKPYTADALLAMLRRVLAEKNSRPPFAGLSP